MNTERLDEYMKNAMINDEMLQITDLVQMNAGWENDVYSVTVATRAGFHHDYILRLYQGSGATGKAKSESEGMEKLYGAGYPVPRIFAREFDAAILGKPFVIMEKIQGRTLAQALRDASPDESPRLLRSFCRLLVELHKLDCRPFASDFTDCSNPYAPVYKLIQQMSDIIRQFGITEMEPVLQWTRGHRNDVPCPRPSVIHWDFHPENVLVRADGKLFVIDWTQIAVSDFRFDLAWTLLVGTANQPAMYPIILQEYEAMAGAKAEHLVFFEAVALMKRLLSMLIPLRFGAESLGMRPDAETIIASNLDYVQFVFTRLCQLTGLRLPALAATVDAFNQH